MTTLIVVNARQGARRCTTLAAAAALAMASAGCTKPKPPPTDAPPEPQATGLRDAVQAPIERARAVEGAAHDAAADQRATMDGAGG